MNPKSNRIHNPPSGDRTIMGRQLFNGYDYMKGNTI